MNRKYLLLFLVVLLFLSFPVKGMLIQDEDSWMGAYFFKENLSKKEKVIPFIDIRKGNFEKETPESRFKTVFSDFVITQNLELFSDINLRSMQREDIDYILENLNLDNIKRVQREINLLFSLKEEVLKKYEKLKENYPEDYYYRFYHIKGTKFNETLILGREKIDSNTDKYEKRFEVGEKEFPDSRKNTKYINSLLPLSYQQIQNYGESPLITLKDERYSPETKAKLKKKESNISFNTYTHINIRNIKITIKDLKDIKEFFKLLESDTVKTVLEQKKIEPEIKEIKPLLEVIKGEF